MTIENILRQEYKIENPNRFIGLTIDLNHLLHDCENQSVGETRIKEWFKKFNGKIKAFHVFCPDQPDDNFISKFKRFLELYNEHKIDAPIFLETKKSSEKIERVFSKGREVIEELFT